MTSVMRLNHVTLIVRSFESCKAFYKALGLIQIVDASPRYARFQCPDGEATLSIEVIDRAPAFPSAQLYFEYPSAAALDVRVAELQKQGLVFEQVPTDMDYLWREARLSDPDGHCIRLYHAGKNRLDPPWRIRA
jgi:catechol 2,3-dioxygenase-like lactoylglutathione lyase family enzyme